MKSNIMVLALAAVFLLVVGMPTVANDGRVPNVIDPGDEHPWGGDQVHDGGDGDGMGPLLTGNYPAIGNFNFFSRLALAYTWRTVSQRLLGSNGTAVATQPATVSVSVRRLPIQPTTRETRNR